MTANLTSVAQRSALPRITRFRVPLADYQHRTGEFLIGGLLAPSVTLLTGAPEAGKSTLARHIVLSLLSDAPLMGNETDHRRHVIHWAGTDSGWRDEFKKDAAKLPGLVDHDERLCLFPDGADIGSFDKDDWDEFTEEQLQYGTTLLVIDHLWGYLGSANSNLAHEVQPRLAPLTRLTEAGIAVLMIHHASKTAGYRTANRDGSGSGSPFIDAWARHRLRLVKTSGQPHRLTISGNSVADSRLQIHLSPDACLVASEPAPDPGAAKAKRESDTAQERINQARRLLAEAPPEELKNASQAGRWMVANGTFGVTSADAGRKKVHDLIRKHGLLRRDGPAGPIVRGSGLPAEAGR